MEKQPRRMAKIQEEAELATELGTRVPVPINSRENPQPELLSSGQRLFLNKERQVKEEEALKEVLKVIAGFHKKGKTQGSIRRLLVDLCEPAMKARGFVISRQEVLNCHVVFGTAEALAEQEKAIKEAAKVAAKAAKERAKREADAKAEAEGKESGDGQGDDPPSTGGDTSPEPEPPSSGEGGSGL